MKTILILLMAALFCLSGCDTAEVVPIETTSKIVEDYTSSDTLVTEPIINDIIEEVTTESTKTTTQEIKETTETKEDVVASKTYSIKDLEIGGEDISVYGDIDIEVINKLEDILDNYQKDISLAIYSIDGSKAIVYNGNNEYFSACTVKIPWMIYLCREIDAGRIDPSTVLTYEERHYHDGSGSIRKGKYGDEYTIERLITLCLSISDNVAYKMLVEDVINRQGFNEYIESLSLDRFKIESWSMWCHNSIPTDFLIIWQDVYNYFEEHTLGAQILKNACTNTIWNYGTATLKDYDYSHKSGDNWEPYAAHNDAGIVWADTPYLYAVFTNSEGGNYDEKVIDNAMSIIHEEFCK